MISLVAEKKKGGKWFLLQFKFHSRYIGVTIWPISLLVEMEFVPLCLRICFPSFPLKFLSNQIWKIWIWPFDSIFLFHFVNIHQWTLSTVQELAEGSGSSILWELGWLASGKGKPLLPSCTLFCICALTYLSLVTSCSDVLCHLKMVIL